MNEGSTPDAELIDTMQQRGAMAASELQASLGVSRATLSRRVAKAGDSVQR